MMSRAVFFDRDGTLNVEKDYVYRYQDWEWNPGVVEGLKSLADLGFKLVVISNQSGVGRGYFDKKDVFALHDQVAVDLLKQGIPMAGFYFCTHGPDDGCVCRKPQPGLLLQAEKDLHIDLPRSYMVGDKLIDVQAALAAGVQPILVGTGYGRKEKGALPVGVPFVEDLLDAFHWIKRREK